MNPAYSKLLGYSRQELLKMNIRELEATFTSTEVEQKIRQMVKQGAHRFEVKHRCRDGRVIDLEVSNINIQQ